MRAEQKTDVKNSVGRMAFVILSVLIQATTGLQPAVLTYMLETQVAAKFGGKVVSDEIGLPVSSNGLVLSLIHI